MFFDKDILHFRRFAKYVTAFWRMAVSGLNKKEGEAEQKIGLFYMLLFLYRDVTIEVKNCLAICHPPVNSYFINAV